MSAKKSLVFNGPNLDVKFATGEKYKDDAEWKAKGIPESEIRKDVRVIMPSLDLFGKTK